MVPLECMSSLASCLLSFLGLQSSLKLKLSSYYLFVSHFRVVIVVDDGTVVVFRVVVVHVVFVSFLASLTSKSLPKLVWLPLLFL